MDKEDGIHTHMHTHNGIFLSHQKEWNLAICSDVIGARGHYTKRNKSEKDKYHMISLMWNLRNKTDEHEGKKNKITKSERETNHKTRNYRGQTKGCWRGGG